MRDILARANAGVLEQFAASNVLLAVDFDGTLAPIVERPGDARLRRKTRDLAARAARRYPLIVLTGRAQADALERVRGVGVAEVIGNHGLEPIRPAEEVARCVRRWVPALERAIRPFRGVWLEDKLFSLAVHYRQSKQKKRARRAIADAVENLEGVRVIGGKQVVNLLPEGGPHKGLALQAVRDRLRCDTAIYLGDDETDEDVFALDEPGRLLGIRVGEKRSSSAAYFVRDQRRVDELLTRLVLLRSIPDAQGLARARVGP